MANFLDRISYRKLQWLLFACLLLHNTEEGLTFAAQRQKVENFLYTHGSPQVAARLPSLAEFRLALIGVTLVLFVLTVMATRGRVTPLKNHSIAALAAILLVNVFVPHLPAAIALGGYAPGVITAVFLNLPFCAYFLRRSWRQQRISTTGVAALLVSSAVVLGVGLPLLWWINAL